MSTSPAILLIGDIVHARKTPQGPFEYAKMCFFSVIFVGTVVDVYEVENTVRIKVADGTGTITVIYNNDGNRVVPWIKGAKGVCSTQLDPKEVTPSNYNVYANDLILFNQYVPCNLLTVGTNILVYGAMRRRKSDPNEDNVHNYVYLMKLRRITIEEKAQILELVFAIYNTVYRKGYKLGW